MDIKILTQQQALNVGLPLNEVFRIRSRYNLPIFIKRSFMKNILLLPIFLLSLLSGYAQNENKTSSTEQEIKKLSNDWMLAAMKRDEKTLNKIVAPGFKLGGTDFENPAISREIWMKNTMENLKIDSINYSKMQVEITENIAIVQSVFYWSVAFGDFPAKKDTVNLIDVWMKRNSSWQVISRIVVDK